MRSPIPAALAALLAAPTPPPPPNDTRKTPMEIADGIREKLKTSPLCICTLPDRRAMELVVEHLSYDEKKRTRFQFHK